MDGSRPSEKLLYVYGYNIKDVKKIKLLLDEFGALNKM